MAIVSIANRWFNTGRDIVIEAVIPVTNSFLLEDGDLVYGYVVNKDKILPLIGSKFGYRTSALQLVYKGCRLAVIFDDINFEGSSDDNLENYIVNNFIGND